jgi:hypothetical protein
MSPKCKGIFHKIVDFPFKVTLYVVSLFIFNKKRRNHFIDKYSNMEILDLLRNTIDNIYHLNIKKIFRTKHQKIDHKLLIRQNNFYNRLQSLKIDTPIDLMNNGVFVFNGGLTDQFIYLAGMVDKKLNCKLYFTKTDCEHGDDKLIFRHFDVKKYFDYEFVKLPTSAIELYEHCGLLETVKPPFLFSKRGDINSMIKKYPDILQLKTPLNEVNQTKLEQIKNSKNPVCLHIRMGDCLRPALPKGYLPKISYFQKSIKKLKKQLGEMTIFVFTNSQELAKARLVGDNMDFVDINCDNESHFELELMRNCQHFITSGGGFSRLASHLSTNKNKIIITPLDSDLCKNYTHREKEWGYKWNNESNDWRDIKIIKN